MKFCIVIPCFNHPATVATVANAAQAFGPVIVVDDGSTVKLPGLPGCTLVRLEKNSGKGAALRRGFQCAAEAGFTHAITMDADGQHFVEDLPKFIGIAKSQPAAFAVGVRDLVAAGCPKHRQRSNAVSSFWFRVETGVRLRDTQCGFRGYPLALVNDLKTKSGRYAFELEFMVRAAWVGTPLIAVPVKCAYTDGIRNSHFRPVKDLAHITFMNIGLVLQSWFVPRRLRMAWSRGKSFPLKTTVHEFFSEHAHEPLRMSLAVGLGLFFGILPIYGVQMAVAATVAHWLRLNKAITLVASNISFGPFGLFICGVAFILGHFMFTGEKLPLTWPGLSRENFWEFLFGSIVLAVGVAVLGTVTAYVIARLVKRK